MNRRNWKFFAQVRHTAALEEWARQEAARTQPPVCDRDSCHEGTSAEVNASRLAHGCVPDFRREAAP